MSKEKYATVRNFKDEETTNSAAVNRSGLFREIFVNNLNNLEEDVTPPPLPTVDVVIRSLEMCTYIKQSVNRLGLMILKDLSHKRTLVLTRKSPNG